MTVVYVLAGLLALWILAAVLGIGSNTVFKNPGSMTDAQLERTIRLTGRIMENSEFLSEAYNKAGKKNSAAMAELTRRYGRPMAQHLGLINRLLRNLLATVYASKRDAKPLIFASGMTGFGGERSGC